ncbi:CMGC/SRPK protein kinase [Plasmodium inui San Antonio 1]|uniref:non-specific serine/threonine protein kinase n=1 Tax=Plasmodium inui San Antonio 1 TaxID=1237626 RepID=W6ZUX3_9APIC|nr:CMGC/SRPK protein kinase [Plasmodium inui San Antonio 1]EUD64547.1 CMGC/SRPK protein kinase [Plasmodium inui San Antonio 1]
MSYSDSGSQSNNSSSQDATSGKLQYTESDDEGSDEYCKGGYHPVKINEVYNNRYRIEGKLGWGHFSTVWVATDLKSKPLKFVAIKIQKGSESFAESAKCEINYLKTVKANSFDSSWVELKEHQRERLFHYNMTKGVVSFIDSFEHKGPNGIHVCMVFEFMGPNLLSLIKHYDYKGIPLNLVRKIATHVLIGLQYLHDVCKIIHSDIKPENVLVSPLSNIPRPRDYSKVDDQQNELVKKGENEVANQGPGGHSEGTDNNDDGEEDQSSCLSEVKDKHEWDNVDFNKLTKQEKRKLRKKKKKFLKKERLKVEAQKKEKQAVDQVTVGNLHQNGNRDKQGDAQTQVATLTGASGTSEDNSHFKKEDNEHSNSAFQINAEHVSKDEELNRGNHNNVDSNTIVNPNFPISGMKSNSSIKATASGEVLTRNSRCTPRDNDKNGEQNNVRKQLALDRKNNKDCCSSNPQMSDANDPAWTADVNVGDDRKDNAPNVGRPKLNKKKTTNVPPYVRHRLRPSNSDPSLLTSYKNIHALQESLMRRPYHYNNYFLYNPEKYGDDKCSLFFHRLPSDYLRKNPLEDSDRDKDFEDERDSQHDENHQEKQTQKSDGSDGGKSVAFLAKDFNRIPIYCEMFSQLMHPEAMKIHDKYKEKKKGKYGKACKDDTQENNRSGHKVVYIKTQEGDYRIRPYDPTVYYHEKSCYKICDLGNSLWVDESRYAEIQTRQYRSPEVILKSGFNETADIWSFACMIFELVTGDFLFNPQKSDRYDKNEEHLSFMIEVLGNIPKYMIDTGFNSHKYFNKNTYKLRNIKNIKRYGLYRIFKYKYNIPEKEINPLCSFLLPMLALDPQKRPSAYTMLQHPWLNMVGLEEEEMHVKDRSYSFNSIRFRDNANHEGHEYSKANYHNENYSGANQHTERTINSSSKHNSAQDNLKSQHNDALMGQFDEELCKSEAEEDEEEEHQYNEEDEDAEDDEEGEDEEEWEDEDEEDEEDEDEQEGDDEEGHYNSEPEYGSTYKNNQTHNGMEREATKLKYANLYQGRNSLQGKSKSKKINPGNIPDSSTNTERYILHNENIPHITYNNANSKNFMKNAPQYQMLEMKNYDKMCSHGFNDEVVNSEENGDYHQYCEHPGKYKYDEREEVEQDQMEDEEDEDNQNQEQEQDDLTNEEKYEREGEHREAVYHPQNQKPNKSRNNHDRSVDNSNYENYSDEHNFCQESQVYYEEGKDFSSLFTGKKQSGKMEIEEQTRRKEVLIPVKPRNFLKVAIPNEKAKLRHQLATSSIPSFDENERSKSTQIEENSTSSKILSSVVMNYNSTGQDEGKFAMTDQDEKQLLRRDAPVHGRNNEIQVLSHSQEEDGGNEINCKVINKKPFCAFS